MGTEQRRENEDYGNVTEVTISNRGTKQALTTAEWTYGMSRLDMSREQNSSMSIVATANDEFTNSAKNAQGGIN